MPLMILLLVLNGVEVFLSILGTRSEVLLELMKVHLALTDSVGWRIVTNGIGGKNPDSLANLGPLQPLYNVDPYYNNDIIKDEEENVKEGLFKPLDDKDDDEFNEAHDAHWAFAN